MENFVAGKTILVTGAAVGIGRAIALSLADGGATVAVTHHSHSATDLVEEVESHGGTIHDFALDGTSSVNVDEVVGKAAAALGGEINFLVNNCGGLVARVPLEEMTDEHWHTVLDLNLSSAFYCTRSVLRYMPDHGRIVNISSLAAQSGGSQGAVAYAAAKAGMNGLTRAAAKALAGRGILVNSIAPGFITDTPFHATFTAPAAQEATIKSLPVGRPGYPSDVAGAVAFLLSPASSFCTGVTLDLTGGAY